MYNELYRRLIDLERRVAGLVVVGSVSQANHENGRYRVKSGDLESDWLPDIQPRAGKTRQWSGRDVGEQVVMACPSGDLAQGVIVGALATETTQAADKGNLHRTIYPDGSQIEYDDERHSYAMSLADKGTFDLSMGSGGAFSLAIEGGAKISAKDGVLEIYAPRGLMLTTDETIGINAQAMQTKLPKGISIKTDGDLGIEAQNVTTKAANHMHLQAGGVAIQSGTLSHNGSNIGQSHVHGGVAVGGSITTPPQ